MSTLIFQQMANGLSVGMAYALLALGLTLIFGVLHVINFSHGEFYMIGGFVAAILTSYFGLPYLLSLPAAVVAVVLLALLVDRIAVRPVLDGPDGDSIVLISTFAIGILVYQTILATYGPQPIRVDGVPGTFVLGSVTLTYQRMFAIVVGICLLAILEWSLRRTAFGRKLRAVAQSAFAAKVVGIDVPKIRTATFIIAAALASLAGALLAPTVAFSPAMGQHAIINAFVVVVVGGMGSVSGAVVCGLLLGIVESVSSIWLPQEVASAFIYGLLLVTLLVRPRGLFSGGLS
ncbi:branched-chain amino acid transport system permease protein [Tardiphaga sp. OK246]|uniref:branched-chain amino acid ABC transporter permease n=1 Tax=Tardiphaga sp. OK246 TaxID=1855307 RepID=UPI000B6EDB83|nr:branched-chain amino acid ABC transporter permease [Tardiphaga sp. OK246]SNT32100.1 branched-chain amino acid transport system permease protein [Tardiphaga sp. OK246]